MKSVSSEKETTKNYPDKKIITFIENAQALNLIQINKIVTQPKTGLLERKRTLDTYTQSVLVW